MSYQYMYISFERKWVGWIFNVYPWMLGFGGNDSPLEASKVIRLSNLRLITSLFWPRDF